jgi:site-specific DNA-methyltransferase (adenine-specific)
MSKNQHNNTQATHLIHGDALAELKKLSNNSIDCIITDPPYSSGGRRENSRSLRKSMIRSVRDDEWIAGDSMATAGFIWTMRELGFEARRILKPGGHLLSFIDWRMAANLATAFESADLMQQPTIVWDKTYFGMGAIFRNQHEFIVNVTNGKAAPPQRRDVGNVIGCKPIRGGSHPTEKPVELLETLISVVCPEGGVIVDPFMGTGATGVAAIRLKRQFIGVELTEKYFDLAHKRIDEEQDNA